MSNLLPCPFCGGDALLLSLDKFWVRCDGCRAESSAHMDGEWAIHGWNQRETTERDALLDEVHSVRKAWAETTEALATMREQRDEALAAASMLRATARDFSDTIDHFYLQSAEYPSDAIVEASERLDVALTTTPSAWFAEQRAEWRREAAMELHTMMLLRETPAACRTGLHMAHEWLMPAEQPKEDE